jgi:hypothetical protein
MVLQWCYSGAVMVFGGVTIVLHRVVYSDAPVVLHTMVLLWCYRGAMVVLQ